MTNTDSIRNTSLAIIIIFSIIGAICLVLILPMIFFLATTQPPAPQYYGNDDPGGWATIFSYLMSGLGFFSLTLIAVVVFFLIVGIVYSALVVILGVVIKKAAEKPNPGLCRKVSLAESILIVVSVAASLVFLITDIKAGTGISPVLFVLVSGYCAFNGYMAFRLFRFFITKGGT